MVHARSGDCEQLFIGELLNSQLCASRLLHDEAGMRFAFRQGSIAAVVMGFLATLFFTQMDVLTDIFTIIQVFVLTIITLAVLARFTLAAAWPSWKQRLLVWFVATGTAAAVCVEPVVLRYIRGLGRVLSVVLVIFCAGCEAGVEKSPVFEGVDLKLLLIGSDRIGGMPELQASSSSVPEYSLKDCEVVLNVPEGQHIDLVTNIMAHCANTIVRFGGRISTNDGSGPLSSREINYETERAIGQFRLYSADVDNSRLKLIAVMLECRRRR